MWLARSVVLAESILDALSSHQVGIAIAIPTYGTNGFMLVGKEAGSGRPLPARAALEFGFARHSLGGDALGLGEVGIDLFLVVVVVREVHVSLDQEALAINTARWDKLAERQRPHHTPESRFRILRLMQLWALSHEETARSSASLPARSRAGKPSSQETRTGLRSARSSSPYLPCADTPIPSAT